jgi:hypothetical protein
LTLTWYPATRPPRMTAGLLTTSSPVMWRTVCEARG